MKQQSIAHRAARAYRQGDFSEALKLYRQLASALGAKYFRANIILCIRRLGKHSCFLPESLTLKRLRVAAVMDDFTFHSYNAECELLQLHPEECLKQLEEFEPNLLFIESAWHGKDHAWTQKISNNGSEIKACIQWCQERGIPAIFWNKEDPVHFDTFLPLAKQMDVVFTTDVDCIPKYRQQLGHDEVYLLPFAAQPRMHNPIELFERKDAFNFAGSYYMRYPERQRDFSALIDAIKQIRPIEIFDRNADNPHPHYSFPEQYKPMILGKLPFSEISRAYKGYRYGINMNTIKQSQSMFARRVFELLASNTVVVSNFSRGMRLLFGDLVVSSADTRELRKRLEDIVKDDVSYRKFRLLGLRGVMSEHTYAHRFAYIRAKLCGMNYVPEYAPVVLLGVVDDVLAYLSLRQNFARQQYPNKQLLIFNRTDAIIEFEEGIHVFKNWVDYFAAIRQCTNDTLIGFLDPQDYYGENYLTDLAQAGTWSAAPAFGKVARYVAQGGYANVLHDGEQYRSAGILFARSALARINALPADWLENNLNSIALARFQLSGMLALDEFNYIEQGAKLSEESKREADDLLSLDTGVAFSSKMVPVSEKLPAISNMFCVSDDQGLPMLDGDALAKLLFSKGTVRLKAINGILHVTSSLKEGKHSYVYASKTLTRAELNLEGQSQFQLHCRGNIEIRTVFEFQNAAGVKISHQMNAAGSKHYLAIPEECTQIRLGLRIAGVGESSIIKLVLGSHAVRPAAIICRSPYLVLTKQYPAYDDLYRYGFLHSRLRAYKKYGLTVSVFKIGGVATIYREFENIDVVTGDSQLLDATLATGQIKHVLVHLLDEQMWHVLEKYIDSVRVTVWVHGAEIRIWQRRKFEFERMDDIEISRQKKLSENRKKFWRSILKKAYPKLHLVFVSEYFMKESCADLGVSLPTGSYSIIHNYIDSSLFEYKKKKADDRFSLLSIRPYVNRGYANDLTVSTIIELSRRPFFHRLTFTLYGDGELFDEITAPLKKFSNVKIERRFLTQTEIAEMHKCHGIFLIPTRLDSQGVSRDEAMSSGLVPVTNNVSAISEFVDTNCGIIVPAEDFKAMADEIERLYHNPDEFMRLSKAASERVRMQCGFEQTIVKEINLIASGDIMP